MGEAEILSHFFTGLAPEADPGFLPDEIDVGLAYDSLSRIIVLQPQDRYTLRSGKGLVEIGRGGTLTLTRYGDDWVALTASG